MTTQNRITGIIQLTRPMHVASPEKSDKPNLTLTVKTPVLSRDGTQYFPYFPGNDLRGRLRSKAGAIVLDHITVSGTKVPLDLYAGLMSGSINNSPATGDLSAEEVLRARQNPYMGLFGGGARVLRSRLRVADIMPIHQATIDAGTVPREFAADHHLAFLPIAHKDDGVRPIHPYGLISKTTIYKKDHVASVARPDELDRYVENALEEVTAYQERVMGASELRKADKERVKAGEIRADEKAKKVGLANIIEYETIITGTPMFLQIDFENDTTDEHIGLCLMSLRAIVCEQALGGVVRAGLGQFRANLTLTRDGETFPIFLGDWAHGDAELSGDVQPFVDAASESLGKLSAADMMAYFVPREVKERANGKKAKQVVEEEA